MNTTHESELHSRLAHAVGKTTYRRLGKLTDTHPETVRRYMQGQSPSTEFLSSLCRNMAINANWLLTGQGPIRLGDVRKQALNEAHAGDLLTAMANSITSLVERIDRLEVYVQGIDTRVRGSSRIGGSSGAASGAAAENPVEPNTEPDTAHESKPTKPKANRPEPASNRASAHASDRIRRAVTKRPPPDDG